LGGRGLKLPSHHDGDGFGFARGPLQVKVVMSRMAAPPIFFADGVFVLRIFLTRTHIPTVNLRVGAGWESARVALRLIIMW
jgi:hypothetical protein